MNKLVFFFCLLSLGVWAQVPNISTLDIQKRKFSYFTSHSLFNNNSEIQKAIITIHGSVRNADTYYKSIAGLAKKFKVQDSTLVISPRFKISGDQLLANELVYSYEGWWIGNDSLRAKISSFSVIDHFIKILSNKKNFPNLKELIITGHSAGGHLVQRLALGSVTDLSFNDLDIKYIVANPGTYAYLNAYRPVYNMPGVFEIPTVRCNYNAWKYGLVSLNRYMKRNPIKELINNYLKRDVTYFLGEKDIGQVEQNCMATIQGPTRLARGKNFKDHLDQFFPENKHNIIVVPNVGHTQYGMYTSDLGKKLLFNK
jgi:hypothetical protein